jgi:hypothetical protein
MDVKHAVLDVNDLLIRKIKKKKELSSLDDEIISKYIHQCYAIYPKLERSLREKNIRTVAKSREFNDVVKFARKSLREVYGVFIMDGFEKKSVEMSDQELLLLHRSTKERWNHYAYFYQEIFTSMKDDMTGKKLKVVDLACGLNIASHNVLEKAVPGPIEYVEIEVAKDDVRFIDEYMKDRDLRGKAIALDLTKEEFEKIPLHKGKDEFLVCFLFKLIDTFEATKRHTSKKLIAYLSKFADAIIITFPMKTIGGRKEIEENKRWWLEGFLTANNMKFTKLEIGDEMVFVVRCS